MRVEVNMLLFWVVVLTIWWWLLRVTDGVNVCKSVDIVQGRHKY